MKLTDFKFENELLNIEYKERKSGDKTFRDIVSFSQVTSKQVLI